MFALIKDNAVVRYPYTLTDAKRDNPEKSIPVVVTDENMASLGALPVTNTAKPAYDASLQIADEVTPVFNAVTQQWEQAWVVRNLTDEEKKSRVPRSVTSRQAKLALLQAGILDDVEAAIASASRAVQIEWEYATEFDRDWPTLAAMQAALGLSDQQLDELFVNASTL